MISFELFGHFHTVVDELSPVFERTLLEMGRLVGLPPPGPGPIAAGQDLPDGEDEVWYLV